MIKDNKATGPDGIPVEIIKVINEDKIEVLVNVYNSIYNTGVIPKEWLKSTFIVLPKKPNAKVRCDHRTISLMSSQNSPKHYTQQDLPQAGANYQ